MKKQMYMILYKEEQFGGSSNQTFYTATYTDSLGKIVDLLDKTSSRIFEFPELKEVTKATISIE